MDKFINVVALNIPYPANYGGVIDIYYKLKALHDCGVRIILHCFEYERPEAPELLDICEEVHYYKRHTGLRTNLTLLPYNVYSRKDPRLLAALLTNDYPILFEGLHSCYYLGDKRLRHRLKIFRECNIEHDYYRALVRSTDNWLKKCFFLVEALRFRAYQREVRWADRRALPPLRLPREARRIHSLLPRERGDNLAAGFVGLPPLSRETFCA